MTPNFEPFEPQTTAACIVVLLLGLVGGGSWPAVRQSVARIDYRVFAIDFLVSMAASAAVVLFFLTGGSLPDMVIHERGHKHKHAVGWRSSRARWSL